tara:strand:- start:676 stop:1431 length:756 start_codon:yes stop_codon:yes gene_type:complete
MSSVIKVNEIQNSSGGAEVKIQTLKHPSASGNNITLYPSNNVEFAGNLNLGGTYTQGTIGPSVTGNWGLKLLETYTVSGSPGTFDMGSASIFSSTYDTYKIIFNDVSFNTNVDFYIQFTLADTGLVNSGNDYDFTSRGFSSNNDENKNSSDIGDFIALNSFSIKGNDTIRQGACGEIIIPNPSATGTAKYVYGRMSYQNSSSFTVITIFTGGLAQNSETAHRKPLVGIRFALNSTNTFQRGTFRLYGVVNA